MNVFRESLLLLLTASLLVGGPALQPCAGQTTRPASAQPATAPAESPWGKTVDGLACRLIVSGKVRQGQPIAAFIEVKNVSDRKRYLLDYFSFYYSNIAAMTVTGPDGKEIRQTTYGRAAAHPRQFKPIAPGEVKRIEFTDLRDLNRGGFASTGRYRLAYSYSSPKPTRIKSGVYISNGKRVDRYLEPTSEQVAGAWVATVKSNPAEIEIVKLAGKNLVVHEWGVFSVYSDLKLANADLKAEWASMPEFFYRQFPTRKLGYMPASWRKPIIYFYTDLPSLKVQVDVTFSKGAPVVWWPCCSAPIDDGRPQQGTTKIFRSLQWSGWLGDRVPSPSYRIQRPVPGKAWSAVKVHSMPSGSWLTKARIKGPALFTTYGRSRYGPFPTASPVQTERFIYYDGLMPAPDHLRCIEVSNQSVTVRNTARFGISDLLLVDRRGWTKGSPVRFARIETLGAGAQAKAAWRQIPAKSWPAVPAKALRMSLLAAGLFAAEADAVLNIWDGGFFHRGGVTGIYVLPRPQYDRMISLAVDPKPTNVVRVGVALHCHLEGAEAVVARARRLIEKLGDASYRVREDATRELAGLGPAAFGVIREALADATMAEVKTRLRQVLQNCDASEYLRKDR